LALWVDIGMSAFVPLLGYELTRGVGPKMARMTHCRPSKRSQSKIATIKRKVVMDDYSIRLARPEEQRELTRLSVRATMHAGYDEAFIDRSIPSLMITLPMISGNWVQVAQDGSSAVVGVVWVTPTALQGIALLQGLYVDPALWKRGIGRVLFRAAAARANEFKAGAIVINAEPSAEGFYRRMGATRIGEVPFYFSPETVLPQLLYVMPREL
jgi:GNAT superfamily N-acetyltransferase